MDVFKSHLARGRGGRGSVSAAHVHVRRGGARGAARRRRLAHNARYGLAKYMSLAEAGCVFANRSHFTVDSNSV